MWPTGAPPILYLDVTKEELKDDFCSVFNRYEKPQSCTIHNYKSTIHIQSDVNLDMFKVWVPLPLSDLFVRIEVAAWEMD